MNRKIHMTSFPATLRSLSLQRLGEQGPRRRLHSPTDRPCRQGQEAPQKSPVARCSRSDALSKPGAREADYTERFQAVFSAFDRRQE